MWKSVSLARSFICESIACPYQTHFFRTHSNYPGNPQVHTSSLSLGKFSQTLRRASLVMVSTRRNCRASKRDSNPPAGSQRSTSDETLKQSSTPDQKENTAAYNQACSGASSSIRLQLRLRRAHDDEHTSNVNLPKHTSLETSISRKHSFSIRNTESMDMVGNASTKECFMDEGQACPGAELEDLSEELGRLKVSSTTLLDLGANPPTSESTHIESTMNTNSFPVNSATEQDALVHSNFPVEPTDINQSSAAVPLRERERDNFGWLIQGGNLITIDPLDTIPLTCIRQISKSGVAKLEYAFCRSANGPGMSMGFSSAAPQPIVVQIPTERLKVVIDYFTEVKGLDMGNARAISTSRTWYGIVEGAHRRKALINLSERHPQLFKGYPWVVICIEWQPLETLRAFARERNEFQRGEHLVDFTVYDVLRNLKQSADTLALREGLTAGKKTNRGYLKRVADHYCGAPDTANSLTRQLAGISVALSWPVIEEMGALLNKEDPEAAREIASKSKDINFDCLDARLCKHLLTRSTFRGATTFKAMASEEDQINTLRRLSFVARHREYKPVSKVELEDLTKRSIAARLEVEKMSRRLGGHSWPADMITAKEALLNTTNLDSEVEEHERNEDLLPTFKTLWERLFPITAELETVPTGFVDPTCIPHPDTIGNSENPSSATEKVDEEHSNVTGDQGSITMGCHTRESERISTDNESTENSQIQDPDTQIPLVEEGEMSPDETPLVNQCVLQQLSIRAINKHWRQFQMDLLSEDLFEFIFADPVQSLSALQLKQKEWTEFKNEKNINEFANFCQISLRPGCYVFAIVRAEEFTLFQNAFHAKGMKTMKDPFFIIPKAESLRITSQKDLPQGAGELAIVARTPGRCFGFNANFEDSYHLFDATFKRKIGIMDNVPRCQNPLHAANSKVEVRTRERHPDFISEILETFCPETGTVLDVFGGAMTTAISSIGSKRACVVLEPDQYCFELALRRLEKLCRDKLLCPDESVGQFANLRKSEIEKED